MNNAPVGISLGMALLAAVADVLSAASGRIEKQLTPIPNPPAVKWLVPGFSVRELPLELNNINNLVFAPDGRLFALCYDGNVLQLKDTNGDGLEDAATFFYRNDKNEIRPSIGMCWGPGGLYIASQGRVLHLRDRGDGTAELLTITGGWVPPTGAAGSNLDAVGIAVDPEGSVFFGLGCDKWNEAYRVNKVTGKSDYSIHSERGTILRVSKDWKEREVICTGMRWPVSLAFNAAGDLFATDQEGATWLPNGNPFDELLHIQSGRHYGFPPRHPRYLPDVMDEPSTFDYEPQHQSTCGLHFNDGKRLFGPEWWRGDAFVAGESRGKIWRTKLVKTASGYVAKTDLIACLKYLTIDAVPTPNGELIVACHSGQPDWGTGPQGKGKLFRISYSNLTSPQPVLAYAMSSTQLRVVFDRKLPPELEPELVTKTTVAVGKYVTAGERFESFRPGYQVVKFQRSMPRFELPVAAAKLSNDRQSILVETSSHREAVNYGITLPGEREEIDVRADLTGVEAVWETPNQGRVTDVWLPHLDLLASRSFTKASQEHMQFFRKIEKRGRLKLRGQLDLASMLHPVVQPESKLDFEYPPEAVTLVFRSDQLLDLRVPAKVERFSEHEVRVVAEPGRIEWLPFEITLPTGGGAPRLDVSWYTAEDGRLRPLPLRRLLLPWAKPYQAVALVNHTPELDGGDWARGRKLFFGDQVACFKCHRIGGEGGEIGPNLSNLIYRDYASVLKDIAEPSAAINPEHIAYNVTLKNGDLESGVILQEDRDKIVLGLATGANLAISRERIAGLKASTISAMPEGLLKGLDAQQQKDLMTFLLTTAPDKPH